MMTISKVVKPMIRATTSHHTQNIVLLVTLDVKNAFNSANCGVMIEAPTYVCMMLAASVQEISCASRQGLLRVRVLTVSVERFKYQPAQCDIH